MYRIPRRMQLQHISLLLAFAAMAAAKTLYGTMDAEQASGKNNSKSNKTKNNNQRQQQTPPPPKTTPTRATKAAILLQLLRS